MKSSAIDLSKRKQYAFDVLFKYADTNNVFRNIMDELFFETSVKQKKHDTSVLLNELKQYNKGDIIIVSNVLVEDSRYINAKCQVMKVNKSSLSLKMYEYELDKSGEREALHNNSIYYMKFNWTTKLSKSKFVLKNLMKITKKGDTLYNQYMKQTTCLIDCGI